MNRGSSEALKGLTGLLAGIHTPHNLTGLWGHLGYLHVLSYNVRPGSQGEVPAAHPAQVLPQRIWGHHPISCTFYNLTEPFLPSPLNP